MFILQLEAISPGQTHATLRIIATTDLADVKKSMRSLSRKFISAYAMRKGDYEEVGFEDRDEAPLATSLLYASDDLPQDRKIDILLTCREASDDTSGIAAVADFTAIEADLLQAVPAFARL